MSSSKKSGNKILGVISRRDAERLLLDWANLPNLAYLPASEQARQRMRSRYPDLFGGLDEIELGGLLLVVRDQLRQAWDASDRRHRDWYLFQARQTFHQIPIIDRARREGLLGMNDDVRNRDNFRQNLARGFELAGRLEEPPPSSPFEATLFHFQTVIADRAKHCQNPECPAPYFIAAKRWQKYCSEECAGPALRESKRRWWAENRAKDGGLA